MNHTMNNSDSLSPSESVTVAIVDSIDGDLAAFTWSGRSPESTRHSYANRIENGKTIWLHCVIMSRMLGRDLLKGEMVDHINGDTLRNTRDNLRLATRSQNAQNRKINKNSKSGFKGVHFHKQTSTWRAAITLDGKCKYLGSFKTPELAARAYNEAAIQVFGEFARINSFGDSQEVTPIQVGAPKPDCVYIPLNAHKHSALKAHKIIYRPMPSNNTSGYKGVRLSSGKWAASITVDKKVINLGRFTNLLDAVIAYNNAALLYRGDSAWLNPLPSGTAPMSGGEQ